MNDADVSRQIQQMVRFIRQEAEEKANEISVSAEEEFNIEKLQLVEAEKKKIRQEYERKGKQVEVRKKIFLAHLSMAWRVLEKKGIHSSLARALKSTHQKHALGSLTPSLPGDAAKSVSALLGCVSDIFFVSLSWGQGSDHCDVLTKETQFREPISHLLRPHCLSLSLASTCKILFRTPRKHHHIPLPKTRAFSPRFLSQTATNILGNKSDSSEVEQLPETSCGGETGNAAQIETSQLESFMSKDVEDNAEKLEELLSLLWSEISVGGSSSLESRFNDMDLSLHEEFMVRVLQTPQLLTENLIIFFTWALKKKPGIRVKPGVLDSLVRAICDDSLKRKEAYWLWDLVKEIGENESDVLKTEILNELIASFSKLGKGKAAMEVFEKFGDFMVERNADTYYFTIEALCRRSMLDWAWLVCEKMIDAERVPGDGEKVGRIISWFCRAKRAKDAHLVYTLAKEKKGCVVPRCAVNFLIASLCRENGTVRLAVEMLDDFEGEAQKYAIKPFLAVIQGLCRTKDVNEAKKLLCKMTTDGPPPGNAVFNSVIHGFSKAGEMGEAIETMKMMTSRGLKPDVYTYTVIISGYTNAGQMQEARKILSEAKKQHSKLSPVTYHTLIRGYCKLEEFDKALELLAEMEDHGVKPNVDEYNKLIQSLCLKALDWETAEKLLDEMKEKGLHLNGITRGLIRAVKEMVEEEVETLKISVEA